MDNCYVLFVKTGREEYINELLKKRLDLNKHLPFIPSRIKLFVKKGVKNKQKQICFPGYIFIESDCNELEFLIDVSHLIEQINEAYYFLNYGSKPQIKMVKEEQLSLQKLMGMDHCIDDSIGFIENDKIIITSGALEGLESSIKKVNRHRREALLEINIMGDIRQIKVALDIVKKI